MYGLTVSSFGVLPHFRIPTNRIQRFQTKILRVISEALFYALNYTLHSGLKVPYITETAEFHCKRFNSRLVQPPKTRDL